MSTLTLDDGIDAAAEFLGVLDGGDGLTFQTFADERGHPNAKALVRVLHGDFDTHRDHLRRLNDAGAGIFVMVNRGDGKGRATGNVMGVRALFVDLDGAPLAPVLEAGLSPHIVVESSPARWHAYWLVRDFPLDEFKNSQQRLAALFDGDRAVCDLPRVMRIPGFLHQKGEPFRSRVVQRNLRPAYGIAEIRDSLTLGSASPETHASALLTESVDSELVADLRSALKYISSDDYDTWIRVGHALKTLGDAGFELWWEWSKSSAKHNSTADRQKWGSLKPSRTSYKVVFAEAAGNGWANPNSSRQYPCKVAPLDEARTLRDSTLKEVLNRLAGAADEPLPADPFPAVEPCPASGFATFVEWVSTTYGLDERGATAVALTIAVSISARQYKERTDIYTIACGTNDARLLVERVSGSLMRGVGQPSLLREHRIGTIKELFESLAKTPSRLYVATDLATQAESARRQNAGTFDNLWAYMADKLPTIQSIQLDSGREAGRTSGEPLSIHAPALSMLAAVREDRLDAMFNTRSAIHALVASALWFDVADVRGTARWAEPESHPTPEWIVQRACTIGPELPTTLFAASIVDTASMVPQFQPGRDGLVGEDVLELANHRLPSDSGRRNARRLAFAVAAWENPQSPHVTVSLMHWAISLVVRGAAEMQAHRVVQENDEGKRSVRAKVLEAIAKTKRLGMYKSDLPTVVGAYRELDGDARDKIIEMLIEDREICQGQGRRGAIRLYGARYAVDLTDPATVRGAVPSTAVLTR